MRRQQRIMGNTAALVSMVLCFACQGLWLRSSFAYDEFVCRLRIAGVAHSVSIMFPEGAVELLWLKWSDSASLQPGFHHFLGKAQPSYAPSYGWWDENSLLYSGKNGRVPLWPAIALCGAWPLMWALLKLKIIPRRRGIRGGHCRSCGYDLRATPERCPECGGVQGAVE